MVAELFVQGAEFWVHPAREEIGYPSPEQLGGTAVRLMLIVEKGRRIYSEGALENRSLDDNGTTRYATEIVLRLYSGAIKMLDSKPEPSKPGATSRSRNAHSPHP